MTLNTRATLLLSACDWFCSSHFSGHVPRSCSSNEIQKRNFSSDRFVIYPVECYVFNILSWASRRRRLYHEENERSPICSAPLHFHLFLKRVEKRQRQPSESVCVCVFVCSVERKNGFDTEIRLCIVTRHCLTGRRDE